MDVPIDLRRTRGSYYQQLEPAPPLMPLIEHENPAADLRLYLRLARAVLRGTSDRGGDAAEAVKVACARLRLSYSSALVWRVLDRVESRRPAGQAARPRTSGGGGGLPHTEAAAWLHGLGARPPVIAEVRERAMRIWMRLGSALRCGGCGEMMAGGSAVLMLASNAGGGWRKLRCPSCAGEPVPAIPEVAAGAEAASREDRIADARREAWHRIRAAHEREREPGEDG